MKDVFVVGDEMSRKYKRNRNGVDYKRLSIYLPQELAARVKAESEARLESQNMVVNKILQGFFKRSDRMVENIQFTRED
tara:strand:- start:89 stop:325 length:237 start_codon:yes stop_codon:yes gene_type:complete